MKKEAPVLLHPAFSNAVQIGVFYEKTGYRAKLHGDIILINRNLKLGKNVSFYPYVQIFGDGLIDIGDNVDIGTGTIFYASRMGGGID